MQNYYRIYAKFDDQTQFHALDVNQGYQVKNLIYASLLTFEELQKFTQFAKNHKGYKLQARQVETNEKININF